MSDRWTGILAECVARGASDVHLSIGERPCFRVSGQVARGEGEPCRPEELEALAARLLSEGQQDVLRQSGAVDLAFSFDGGERFRGHFFREKKGLALAARRLERGFRTLEELNLPASLWELARLPDGLVLFTGPTGSGKSTTLATLLDAINRARACHILTIEDPVEYVHENRRALVHQREVHRDVGDFAEAVRSSLREDPDVILVGEMRDVETMRAAVMVAETGHLVFSTLHCGSAVGALDRIIGAFEAGERESLCQQLSMTLKAVIAQHLLPRADGGGRVPAVEILNVTKGIANLIRNHKSEQIYSAMEGGGEVGMRTLEQSLAALVVAGAVSLDVARASTEHARILEQRIQAGSRGRMPASPRRG